jgi:hypothetical protein
MVGILVIVGYAVLRFGFIAVREEQDGASPSTIVLSILGYALAAFVVVEIVLWCYHLHTRARERSLAASHPNAAFVPVLFKRDLVREVTLTAEMLGLPVQRVPRSGYGTLVSDGQGIGVYAGGGNPYLVLGLARGSVQSVGVGETSGAGRYSFGTIPSLRIVASTPQHFASVDLPVYRRVVGFPRILRGEALASVVRQVSLSSGTALLQAPGQL